MITARQPFRPIGARIAPFAGACCLAWAAVPIGLSITWWEYWASLTLALTAGLVAVAALMYQRLSWVAIVPSALLLLAAIGLLRDAGGGIPSGVSAMAILPVFQVALYSRSRRDMGLVLAALALFFLVPIWVVGGAGYPQTQYRTLALTVAADAIIGLTTQALVARVLRIAGEARARERMLEQVATIVDTLFDSPRPRRDVCEAAMSISGATSAVLYEPATGVDQLTCTAAAGLDIEAHDLLVPLDSPVNDALRLDQPRLLTGDVQARVAMTEVWIARGRPQSLLYQPLRRGDNRLGVLVIGWNEDIQLRSSQATTVALLAHEAAAVISRADTVDQLHERALTDELTGLPNRRAWDQHLHRLAARHHRFTIAILDLDHFKQFNDSNGHPTGDRLLKETAAAWRDQLRAGDLLARIGGEEFGLLLSDRDHPTATDIVDRLRDRVTHDQTCSAGIAIRSSNEPPQATVQRADQALYAAKAHGRNRTALVEADGARSPAAQP